MTDIKQTDGLSLQSPLRFLSVLLICLLLTKYCRGQPQVIGPTQPIVATVGDNIILPCHLEPAVDVAAMTLEWTRSDLESTFAFVWRAEREVTKTISPSYKGRTSLFTDELKRGNISLKLSDVRPSDAGRYKCFIPDMSKESYTELVVGAVSSPVITSVEIDRDKAGVVLQCECAGWYPEPEVLWLDGEGKLLSAGPTETVRGPDDLYTVSSRVTVEKRHSNSFTCRVQQRDINQTRETHIQVPADFLMVQAPSSNDTTGLTVGLTAGLAVCIAVILILLFFVWKLRQNQNENSSCSSAEVELSKAMGITETNRGFPEENNAEETMRLMTVQTISRDSEEDEYKSQLQVERQRREDAEDTVKTLEQKLEVNQAELQKLTEENEQLRNKPTPREENEEFMENQDDTSRQLQDEQKEAESKNKELEAKLDETMTQLQDERRRREGAESKNKELEDKLAKTTNQLQDEEQKMKDAEKEVENLRTELKNVKQANERCKEELRETQSTLDKRNAEIRDLKKKKEEDEFKRQLGRRDPGKPQIPQKTLMNKNREEEEEKKGDEEAQKDDATFKTLEDLEDKNKDEQETESGAEKEVETQAEVGTSEEKVLKPETECDTSEEKLEATTDSKEQ